VDLGIDGYDEAVEIGRGGFGVVYKARQARFNRTVAIKVLPDLGSDEAARQRFERECVSLGTVSGHPQIVTVLDSGATADGRPYLSMAYLPKGSMADRLQRDGRLGWTEAVDAAIKIAGALESAHRAGIVHRDIKPENLLLSDFGEPQLADFGIARITGGHETRSGLITASIVHAAPEVLAGQRPSPASDLYSLASTLYELIAGAPAFARDTDESVAPMIARISREPPPNLRAEGVPDGVARAIERAMAKDPAARQPSVEEFGQELREAQRRAGVPVTSMMVAGGAGATVIVAAGRAGAGAGGPTRSRRRLLALAGAGAAVAIAAVLVLTLTRGGAPSSPTSSTRALGFSSTVGTTTTRAAAPANAAPAGDIAAAVLEPARLGGLPLGTSKEDVVAAFGTPDSSTVQQNTGGEYTQLVWTRKFGEGFVAVTLYFKSGTRYSPGLTNWIVAGPGPHTVDGIAVGDDQSKAEAIYGPAMFGVIQIDDPGGRLMISFNEKKVAAFLGGDPDAINQA